MAHGKREMLPVRRSALLRGRICEVRRGGWPVVICCLAVLLLCGFPGFAAGQPDDRVSLNAIFGWGGHIPTERWSPVTVYIHSPGRSISGVMLIEYAQDAHQQARIAVPFAAVADRTTAVQAVICIPPECDSVSIRLLDERGRRLAAERFTHTPTQRTGVLGIKREYAEGLLVCVGLPRLPDAMRALREIEQELLAAQPAQNSRQPWERPRRTAAVRWDEVLAVTVSPGDLPLSAMGYDSVMGVVVSGDAGFQVSRAALDAVHQWVLSGGRLVIVADGPGEQWRNWLPEEARQLIRMHPPDSSELPSKLAEAVGAAAMPLEREVARPEAVESLAVRAIELTAAARREGWTVRHGEGGAALVAEGPVGYGYVTVLGFDPHKTTRTISSHGAAAVWVQALETIARDFFASNSLEATAPAPGVVTYWYGYASRAQQAINVSLERLANVPVLGYTVFVTIAGAVLALALLVGPIDYLVLKRRKALQRSWMTALFWIALASAAGIAAPRVIRTDPTQVNRFSVIDQMAGVQAGEQGLGFTTGLTGMYAGHAGTSQLTDVDPASWWRGTTAVYSFQRGGSGTAPVPTFQAAAGGEMGSLRGNAMHSLPLAQWTFRTFFDQSPRGLPLGARLEIAGDEQDAALVITGLPGGCRIVEGLVQGGIRPGQVLVPSEITQGPGVGEWRLRFAGDQAEGFHSLPSRWLYQPGGRRGDGERNPGAALALPGPDRRGLAVESRIASGSWGAVYLWMEGMPPYPTLDWKANAQHTAVIRLLFPVEDGGQP
jgi:hypothetical protein